MCNFLSSLLALCPGRQRRLSQAVPYQRPPQKRPAPKPKKCNKVGVCDVVYAKFIEEFLLMFDRDYGLDVENADENFELQYTLFRQKFEYEHDIVLVDDATLEYHPLLFAGAYPYSVNHIPDKCLGIGKKENSRHSTSQSDS